MLSKNQNRFRILTEVIKIVPINVIITKGNFKGVIGELVSIEGKLRLDKYTNKKYKLNNKQTKTNKL